MANRSDDHWSVCDGAAQISVDERGQIALDSPKLAAPLALTFVGWLELQRCLNEALGEAHLLAVRGVRIPWS